MSSPLEERFFAKVDRSGGPEACWRWTGGLSGGYGSLRIGKRGNARAHRLSYALANGGPIPDGLSVLHKCDNPICVRPDHLFLGTQATNMADRGAKGRQAKGESNGRAKLTENEVHEIVAETRRGTPNKQIARRFGVGRNAVGAIVRGDRWSHLTRIEQRRAA